MPTEEIYNDALEFYSEVKHSVRYRNDDFSGIYIPKDILPRPYPRVVVVRIDAALPSKEGK